MKILVAVDGSEYTKRMLGYLAAHDEWLGSSQVLTVLHVASAVPPRAATARAVANFRRIAGEIGVEVV